MIKNDMKYLRTAGIGLSLLILFPVIASAQETFDDYLYDAISLGMLVTSVLIAVAVVVFFWGLIKLLVLAQSGQEVREGKKALILGIIGMFLLMSIWGVALFIRNDFFGDNPGGGMGSYFIGDIIPILPE